MGRLIDADKFKGKVIASHTGSGVIKLIAIDEVPTAYDPEKVVKQLEELRSLVPVNRVLDDIVNEKPKELGMLIAYRKAIEIVKGGGADQELECKWKLEEEGNLYVTECENRHIVFDGTPEENGYRYCPYCGRKIKEVE